LNFSVPTKEKVSFKHLGQKKSPATARRRRKILRVFACKKALKQFGNKGQFQKQF